MTKDKNAVKSLRENGESELVVRAELPQQTDNGLQPELYTSVSNHIHSHLQEIQGAATRKSLDAILEIYIREWNHYLKVAASLGRMLEYLDRFYVTRIIAEGAKGSYRVRNLALLRWKLDFVDQESRIVPRILDLIERQRNGEAVDNLQLKAVLESFQTLCIKREWEIKSIDNRLEFYQTVFEGPFLKATESHYRAKLEPYLADSDSVKFKEMVSYINS